MITNKNGIGIDINEREIHKGDVLYFSGYKALDPTKPNNITLTIHTDDTPDAVGTVSFGDMTQTVTRDELTHLIDQLRLAGHFSMRPNQGYQMKPEHPRSVKNHPANRSRRHKI